jgi:hypothetical protein
VMIKASNAMRTKTLLHMMVLPYSLTSHSSAYSLTAQTSHGTG